MNSKLELDMQRTVTLITFLLITTTWALAQGKPNILLIFADDVGSDAIGCYGGQSYQTPNIDALASGGMKFDQGFAMPVCHPSRICLLTGKYPFRHGAEGFKWGSFPKAAEGTTVANRFKSGGYATAVAGKWQLCLMKNDLDQPQRLGFDEWLLFGWHEGGRYHDPLLYHNGALQEDTEGKYGPDLYVEFLIDFMQRSHEAGKPFFAYYPMALCHDVTDDLKGRYVSFYKDNRWMTYPEMISSMDDMVGRLVSALDQMKIRDNTLIIYTTDNGTPNASYFRVNEAGKMVRPKVFSIRNGQIVPGGKGRLDDTGTRVPWIANWPGRIEPGTVVDNMVDLTDLLPTLSEVAGLENETTMLDGISFAPVLFGNSVQRRRPWVYLEHRGKRAIRSMNFKLYADGPFFDLSSDPLEKSPLNKSDLSAQAARELELLEKALAELE